MAAAVRSSASSQLIRCQPGSASPFGRVRSQRMSQPVGVIDQFRRGASLGAERLTGRVRRVGLERDEAAVLDRRDGAAARDAEGAKRFDLSLFIHRWVLAQFDAVEEPN